MADTFSDPSGKPWLEYDASVGPVEGAKRDLEATAWAIALAAPGLFAGLGQVDKLFRATRFPSAFGYVFGTMMVFFVLSMILGVKNYTRLHSILSVYNAMQGTNGVRRAREEWLKHEWAQSQPDMKLIEDLQTQVREAFETGKQYFSVLAKLQANPQHLMSLQQRKLLEYAYWLFVLILLTSDFGRLVR